MIEWLFYRSSVEWWCVALKTFHADDADEQEKNVCIRLVRPEGCDHLVGTSPSRALAGWHGCWQAVRLGNGLVPKPCGQPRFGWGSESKGGNVCEA